MLKKQVLMVIFSVFALIISGCSGSKGKSSSPSLKDGPIPKTLSFDGSQVSKVHLNDQDRTLGLSLMKSMAGISLNGGGMISNKGNLSYEQKQVLASIQQNCSPQKAIALNSGGNGSLVVGKAYPLNGTMSVKGTFCPIMWDATINGAMTVLNQSSNSAAIYLALQSNVKQSLLTPDVQQAFLSKKSEQNLSVQMKEEVSNNGLRLLVQVDGSATNEILPAGVGAPSEPVSFDIKSKYLVDGGLEGKGMKLQVVSQVNFTYRGKSFPLTVYINGNTNNLEGEMRAFLGDSELKGGDLLLVQSLPLMGAEQLGLLDSLNE
ncbi:MAG: hypothetical protein H6623_07830 [Bdellovibrionaceae bacterium]|nr:hypothetical protein [Pseudobdellovibrionaceae bacterium]